MYVISTKLQKNTGCYDYFPPSTFYVFTHHWSGWATSSISEWSKLLGSIPVWFQANVLLSPSSLSCGHPSSFHIVSYAFEHFHLLLGKVIQRFELSIQLSSLLHFQKIPGRCLEALFEWIRVNKLKLNPNIVGVLLLKAASDPKTGISLVLCNIAFLLKEHVCSLGVLLNPGLCWVTGDKSGQKCFSPVWLEAAFLEEEILPMWCMP